MEQLRDFLNHLRLNRNASAHTVAAYDSDLSQFVAFAAQQSTPRRRALAAEADLDPRHLIRGVSSAELHRQQQTARVGGAEAFPAQLRTFVRYLRREGLIDSDPAALVVSPKREQKVPAHLSVDEMSPLLEMPDVGAARPPRSRDPRAVLRVGDSPERAGRPGSRGRGTEGAGRPRDGQRRQGTDRSLQRHDREHVEAVA